MIVEILDDHGRPHRLAASRVLVRDTKTLTPVAVMMEFVKGGLIGGTAADKDFQSVLTMTGIDETVITTELPPAGLQPPSIQ